MKNTFHRIGAGTAAAFFVASGAGAGSAFAAPASDVLLLTVPAEDVKELAGDVGDLDIVSAEGDKVIVLGDQELADELEKSGADVSTETYATSINSGARPSQASASKSAPVPSKLNAADYDTFFEGYRTTGAYAKFAKDLAEQYPELVQHVDFGDTYLKQQGQGGHDLVAVRITAGVKDQPSYTDGQDGKPRFFLGAQTHSREIITSEMAWRFASEIIEGYGKDAQITSLLDSTEVWIAFQHNPDSIDVVEKAFADGVDTTPAGDGNPDSQSKAWQRKNQNATGYEDKGTPWSRNQPGIDLNRNWPYGWGGASTSSDPASILYKGSAPASEPEAAALKELLEGLYGTYNVETSTPAPNDRTGTYIHLHSYSNLVLYPYGFDNAANVPNTDALQAGAFRQSYGNDYATGAPGDVLYNASGGDFDWVYGKLEVPGYVYEIGTGEEGGFFPGFQRADSYWEKVGPGLRFAAEAAYEPYTTSLGGVVSELKAERQDDGSISVSGTATDEAYGNDAGSASRRPEVTKISDVEVAASVDRNALDAGEKTGADGDTVTTPAETVEFDTTVPKQGSEKAEFVFARAKNGSGEFGPWQAVFVDPVDDEETSDPEPTDTETPDPDPTETQSPSPEPTESDRGDDDESDDDGSKDDDSDDQGSDDNGRDDDKPSRDKDAKGRDDRSSLPRTGAGLWPLAAGAALLIAGGLGVWTSRRKS